MEDKRYPTLDEEDGYGCMKAAEPVASYATREYGNSAITYVDNKDAETIDRVPFGAFAFYTEDPEVFEQHAAEIEADMDEVDAGIEDPERWMRVDDFWAAMRKEHPWL